MRLTIRAKLVGLALLVGLMISGPLAVYTLVVERSTQIEEIENKGVAAASLLAETLIDPLYQLRIDQVERLLEAARSDQDLVGIYALDRDGLILSDGGNDSPLLDQRLPGLDPILEQVRRSPRAVPQREDGFIAVTGPVRSPDGAILGFVHLRLSLRHAEEKIAAEWRVLAALGGAVFLLGGLLALVLARQLTRPLREMAAATQSIRRGDFAIHVPVERQDELGALAQAINEMAEDLQQKTVSKRYLDNIIRSMGDTLIVTDAQGRIRTVNPSAIALLGYEPEQLLGEPAARILGEEIDLAAANSFSRRETCYRTSLGDPVQVSLSLAALTDDEGCLSGFVLAAQDITEFKKLESSLKRLNETLERRVQEEVAKNREKDHLLIRQSRLAIIGEMIGNIAHQWRQPLNALTLLLGNIKDAHEFNELDQEYLDKSVKSGQTIIQSMSGTIDDFRNFFKPDREKKLFSLEKAVRDALSVVEASFRCGNIAVELNMERDIAVMGIPNEYAQVVANILGNAKEAILERKVQNGRVEIVIGRDDVYAYADIRDNGGGVSDSIIEKIFDPYFTTREKGTGIGLYMSKMIIETNMNGRIEVRNIGAGAEFRIATPLYEDGTGNGCSRKKQLAVL